MDQPFYKNGLQFECTQCSKCCRHDPGFVFLTQFDVDLLLSGLEIEKSEFFEKYCRIIDINGIRRVSLIENEVYDCIFWCENGCQVYETRPLQCRSYPFWAPFLETSDDWEILKESCPGVGKGRIHSAKEIKAWLEKKVEVSFLSAF